MSDVGTLYDIVGGKRRFALIVGDALAGMSYETT
jgi:hypothetical protein